MVAYWCSGFEYHIPIWDDALANTYQLTIDGTVIEGVSGKWVTNAAIFDGSSFLYRASETVFKPSARESFTVCAWVWLNNVTDAHCFIAKREAGVIEFDLSFNPANKRFTFKLHDGTYLYTATSTNGSIVAGRWYHVMGTFRHKYPNAGSALVLVNGNGSAFFTVSASALAYDENPLVIGGSDAGFLNGRLSDVSMWRRELTSSDRLGLQLMPIIDLISAPIVAASDGGSGFSGYPTAAAPATAPTSFEIDETGTYPVLLWVSENVNSIAVEIQRDGGAGFVSVREEQNNYSWEDISVTNPGTASYRIRSVNMFGASAWSATVTLGATAAIIDGEGTITDGEGTLTDGET